MQGFVSAKARAVLGKRLIILDTCECILLKRRSWCSLASWVAPFLFAGFVSIRGGGGGDHGEGMKMRCIASSYWFSGPNPSFTDLLAVSPFPSGRVFSFISRGCWRDILGEEERALPDSSVRSQLAFQCMVASRVWQLCGLNNKANL